MSFIIYLQDYDAREEELCSISPTEIMTGGWSGKIRSPWAPGFLPPSDPQNLLIVSLGSKGVLKGDLGGI